jgi:CheY-like chemotaxis protein
MLKVLVVDDDLMIADMVEEVLVTYGYEVCGIAPAVAEAVALVRLHRPDLAVIDIRLADGELGTEIAAQLTGFRRPGILYASGNTSHLGLTSADGDAFLTKPYRAEDLVRGLEIVAAIVAGGTASPPFPRGFQVLPLAGATPREISHV